VNATYDDWQKITSPRVQGAQDLHELLPDLDFMVLLSSFLAATGNVGQSIYSGTSVSVTAVTYSTKNKQKLIYRCQSFFDAFASYRNAQGLPATSIALPVVLDVGYVADRNLTETLKTSLGATLTQAQMHTLVKGAIIGPSSNLNHNGNALSLTFVSGEDSITRPWQCFRPRSLVQLMKSQNTIAAIDASGPDRAPTRPNGLSHASTADLLDALISKVSSITMIDRDEVEPDAPLANYSLDSLVSVELRNWIRRETRVDLSLPKIVGAPNLRALAEQVRSLRDK
jgi:acyl carrier protein